MFSEGALIIALGFLGQSMFGARTVAQWIIAEREGRIVSPTIFWIFSLVGASIFLVYGIIRRDIVIIFGQSISFYIYARNLYLKRVWSGIPLPFRIVILLVPPALLAIASRYNYDLSSLWSGVRFSDGFLLAGIAGQLLLNFRYFYQWYYSEKANESLLPLGFWMISALASIMVIVYSIYRNEIVLLVAQSGGLIAYARNIYLHFKASSSSNLPTN